MYGIIMSALIHTMIGKHHLKPDMPGEFFEQSVTKMLDHYSEKYLTVIRKAAGDYTKEIFHKLREREYNPELMRLYMVGGGGCMIQNFGEYDKSRVTIVRDICATAKGYEAMTVRKIQRNGGMLV